MKKGGGRGVPLWVVSSLTPRPCGLCARALAFPPFIFDFPVSNPQPRAEIPCRSRRSDLPTFGRSDALTPRPCGLCARTLAFPPFHFRLSSFQSTAPCGNSLPFATFRPSDVRTFRRTCSAPLRSLREDSCLSRFPFSTFQFPIHSPVRKFLAVRDVQTFRRSDVPTHLLRAPAVSARGLLPFPLSIFDFPVSHPSPVRKFLEIGR